MPTSERPVALTTPTVTVWSSPNGLPMAIAHSPTRSVSESASAATRTSPTGWNFTMARSVLASVPTMRPWISCLEDSLTVTLSAPRITWKLVST